MELLCAKLAMWLVPTADSHSQHSKRLTPVVQNSLSCIRKVVIHNIRKPGSGIEFFEDTCSYTTATYQCDDDASFRFERTNETDNTVQSLNNSCDKAIEITREFHINRTGCVTYSSNSSILQTIMLGSHQMEQGERDLPKHHSVLQLQLNASVGEEIYCSIFNVSNYERIHTYRLFKCCIIYPKVLMIVRACVMYLVLSLGY